MESVLAARPEEPPPAIPDAPPEVPEAPPANGLVRRVLIRSPEIRIKGRNRPSFREALKRNLGRRLKGIGLRWAARSQGDRIWFEPPDATAEDLERGLAAIRTVFGVELALPAWVLPQPDGWKGPAEPGLLPRLVDITVALTESPPAPDAGFALDVRRRNKQFPFRSQEIAAAAGRAVLDRTDWNRVDLSRPAFTVFVEAHEDGVYWWTRRLRGPGGLPVGAAGRLTALLSGGFDSPVASWMMAGRGASLDFVHLTPSRPDPEDPTSAKAIRLARVLSRYTGRSRLLLVPYTRFDLALTGRGRGYAALLFRRFALRCAESAAARFGAAGLVTGDSLSQVASQTLENLVSTDAAVSLPVFRPLIGMSKAAIMEQARRIGSYSISEVPAKDCCALIAASPRTRSKPRRVAAEESRLIADPGALVEDSLGDSLLGVVDGGEVTVPFAPPDFERRVTMENAPAAERIAEPVGEVP